ncbi:MAG: hypothetical protein ACJ74H_18580 [Thermoanaerobaculia bacterium]
MAAATEMDVLESRVARVEASLRAIEERIGAIEHVPPRESVAPVIDEAAEPPLFDFALIGKSVLIVGGAYLLRALTEIGAIPQAAGAVLSFLYAMAWIAIADRAMARGRRTAALFDAATAALIAGGLLWEATTRFHVFAPAVALMLTVIAAVALMIVAVRRQVSLFALFAAALTTFTSIGLVIGTLDVLLPAIAVTVTGIIALRLRMESYVTVTLAIVSDFLALALVVMTAIGRSAYTTPSVVIALLIIAVSWIVARPADLQTATAMFVGVGGASVLALDGLPLAILWSAIAVATLILGRHWMQQAPFWVIAATVVAFTVDARFAALSIVDALTIVVLILTPIDAFYARLALFANVAVIALTGAAAVLSASDPGVLAMERSVVLALAAVLLALLGIRYPEAAILARIVLGVGALKFLIDDFRTGRATTIVVALAAYGTAMVLIAQRRLHETDPRPSSPDGRSRAGIRR